MKQTAVERIKTFFVIRELSSGKYLSVDNMLDDWNMCKEFDNEESALKELEKLDGFFGEGRWHEQLIKWIENNHPEVTTLYDKIKSVV